MIYVSNQVIGRTFNPVIIIVATGVVAKFLIGTASYLLTTVQANRWWIIVI